ncbi:sterol desaturase family protein [Hanstruepera marina]|uniref:sterol desaturase family protein n=1 Tax=Hanstruepera marina TaxID=2873265 RepID=UPI001CA7A8E1|nr:sterol desaturase family protein [Hanstruepera marina]
MLDDFSKIELWLLGTFSFIIRYFLIAGVLFYIFYMWKKKEMLKFKIQQSTPKFNQIKKEILYSISTFLIYGVGIFLFLFWIDNGYTKQYKSIDEFGVLYFVFSILIMIVTHDAYFYWTHRLMHYSKLFQYAHKTHHLFNSPTPWASFAFHPLEAIISIGIIPIIIFVIPFHHWALVIFVTFLMVYNTFIHLGYFTTNLKFFRFQNTSKDHDLHHNGLKGNYGLYFTVWDRLMGTYKHNIPISKN